MARAKLSSLVGRVDDAQAAEEAQPGPSAPAPQQKAPEAVTETQAAGPAKRTKYPPKVSFYQDRDKTDRIRGAILHTMAQEGVRTLSQFLDAAAMKEVERLEAKYNNGKPFPPVGARELPQGRPMGE
ncbi:ParB family protein [Microbacterium arborescens]